MLTFTKMFKLSLTSMGGALSRDEMKQIMGGVDFSNNAGSCPLTCTGKKICDSANGCRCSSRSNTCLKN